MGIIMDMGEVIIINHMDIINNIINLIIRLFNFY